jgi:hypothetical protein
MQQLNLLLLLPTGLQQCIAQHRQFTRLDNNPQRHNCTARHEIPGLHELPPKQPNPCRQGTSNTQGTQNLFQTARESISLGIQSALDARHHLLLHRHSCARTQDHGSIIPFAF